MSNQTLESINTNEGVILNFAVGTIDPIEISTVVLTIATVEGVPSFVPHKTQTAVEVVKVYSGQLFGLMTRSTWNNLVAAKAIMQGTDGSLYTTVRQRTIMTTMPAGVVPFTGEV